VLRAYKKSFGGHGGFDERFEEDGEGGDQHVPVAGLFENDQGGEGNGLINCIRKDTKTLD